VFVEKDLVWRAYSARPDLLAGFKEPLCGREGRPGCRGVARIFEWGGDERRRREKRGAKGGRVPGGGVPLPAGGGVWGVGCAPPQKNFDYLTLKWCILVRI